MEWVGNTLGVTFFELYCEKFTKGVVLGAFEKCLFSKKCFLWSFGLMDEH